VKIIACPDGSGTEKAAKSDRIWFRNHPKRQWRVRPFIDGEENGEHDPPAPGLKVFTFVERLPSGAFMRRFLASRTRSPNCDRVAEYLFIGWTLAGEETAVADIPPKNDLGAKIRAAGLLAMWDGYDDAAFPKTVDGLIRGQEGAAQ
jgi:hypothetical protein